jgi:hypothetical protein
VLIEVLKSVWRRRRKKPRRKLVLRKRNGKIENEKERKGSNRSRVVVLPSLSLLRLLL